MRSRTRRCSVYKGLAIVDTHLYATDFKNARVDEFAGDYSLATAPGAFVDPSLPAGYAPFEIQAIAGNIDEADGLFGSIRAGG